MDAHSGAPEPGGRLILSAAGSPVERDLIERWAAAQPDGLHGGSAETNGGSAETDGWRAETDGGPDGFDGVAAESEGGAAEAEGGGGGSGGRRGGSGGERRGGDAPSTVIDLDVQAIARMLAGGGDPLLVPVRIAWLPKERDGRSEVGWSDLLRLRDPRRPGRRRQGRLAGQDGRPGQESSPSRYRIPGLKRVLDRIEGGGQVADQSGDSGWGAGSVTGQRSERYRVVVGEPARASELRRRFRRHTALEPEAPGARPLTTEFSAFVYRQATLALERAERAVIGDRYKVPRLVVEEITTGARYRQRIADLARRLRLPADEVGERAEAALRELVAVQSRLAVDVFGAAMRPLHARAWRVRTQAGELDRLRELNRRSALIFLPSHRSYADTLVLADVLHQHDFPRNHVVGGDNLAVWPFAPLARRAGLVFIRRSFREDDVYKLAIQEYFGYLVAKRFNLEWYLEGGRSRTGKLRPPKLGLLAYVAGALRNEPAIDVQLVPVSITYERLAEVSSMAAEQRGAAKEREGFGWLARYARGQRRSAGDAVVRFGSPVSMRQRLDAVPADDEPAQRLALNKLAFEVAVGINRATPVLPQSLVTLALLGVRDRALTLDQVSRILAPLLDYVQARNLPESGTALLRHPGRVAGVLADLVRAGVVTSFTGGDEPVYSITPGQHLVAAFYRNNSIHWFVNRAIVELAMIAAAESRSGPGRIERMMDDEISAVDAAGTDNAGPEDESGASGADGAGRAVARAWAEALRLRDLLKFEFFFPDKDAFRAELIGELELMDPRWTRRAGSVDDVRALLASSGFLVAHRVLRSFVEAELVVAERLAGHGGHQLIDEKSFLAECAGTGQQMLLQGRVHSAEALSGELFGSALRLAAGRHLLDPPATADPIGPAAPAASGAPAVSSAPAASTASPDSAELSALRQAFAAEIRAVSARIRLAADIDASLTPP